MPDLIVTDINGTSEFLTDFKTLRRKRRVNGEYSLSFLVFNTERNAHSFTLIQEESILECDGQQYRIKDMKKNTVVQTVVKQARADHVFFDFIDHYVYGKMTGTHSITEYMDFITNGSDYTYQILDSFDTADLGEFGDDNGLALLQEILDTFGAEVDPDNKIIKIYSQIGVNSHFQFRYRHNLKTLDYMVNTDNLSTYIKGFGKQNDDGTYVVETDYTSPNASKFGTRHAKPIQDERYTTVAGLQARLQKELNDEPEVSITITFAELKRAGYEFEVIGCGDSGYLIHEPMDLDMSVRVLEYEEDLLEVDASNVTIGNFVKSSTDILSDFKKTEKTVNKAIDNKGKVRYNVLDDAVKIATEAINNARTKLEFPVEGGIIARDPTNANRYLIYTSEGLGLTEDGGQTFKYAITHSGINAELIVVNYMLFNYLKGGELTLGGASNGNGVLRVLDENGELVAELDGALGGFEWLRIGNVISDSVVKTNITDMSIYVDSVNGNDLTGDGTSTTPFKTLQKAINSIPKYNEGAITIYLTGNTTEDLEVSCFIGSGIIEIHMQNYQVNGYFDINSNLNRIKLFDAVLNVANNTYAGVNIAKTKIVDATNIKIYGQNACSFGFSANDASFLQTINCEIYDVTSVCIRAAQGSTVYVENCKGLAPYGLQADATGTIGGKETGTAPAGSTSNTRTYDGGEIRGTFTHDSGAATPPAPPDTTSTWSSISADNWSSSGYWGGDGVKQGNYGYGRRTGYWFFGTGPSSTVTGKTIKRMRAYIKRVNKGGSSGNVTIYLRWHTYTSKPSSASNMAGMGTEYKTVALSWGDSAWVELPSSFYDDFQNGSAKGIGVYVDSDSSSYYAVLDSLAKLEITYV